MKSRATADQFSFMATFSFSEYLFFINKKNVKYNSFSQALANMLPLSIYNNEANIFINNVQSCKELYFVYH